MAGLFACTKCHSRHPFDELSKEDQLCKICIKKYPLLPCHYCQLDFHVLNKVHGRPVCKKCTYGLEQYGEPHKCKYCQTNSAFNKSCCSRCISSERKYGKPVRCTQCRLERAFKKPNERAGSRLLCLQCTLEYKRMRQKEENSPRYNITVAPLRAENLAVAFKPTIHSSDYRRSGGGNSPLLLSDSKSENGQDDVFGDPISEITKLRDQIATLKRIISQKEKVILEKDKKISEFRAEQWEKEKQLKQKGHAVQKDYQDRLNQLKVENQSLKRQVSLLIKPKKAAGKSTHVSSVIRIEAHKISGAQTPEQRNAPGDEVLDQEILEKKLLHAAYEERSGDEKEAGVGKRKNGNPCEEQRSAHGAKKRRFDESENKVNREDFTSEEISAENENELTENARLTDVKIPTNFRVDEDGFLMKQDDMLSSDDEGTFEGFSDRED